MNSPSTRLAAAGGSAVTDPSRTTKEQSIEDLLDDFEEAVKQAAYSDSHPMGDPGNYYKHCERDEARKALLAALPSEPGVDVAALNRELCEKEGHVLGVVARPCLRCHKWFDPQYGRNMPRDGLTLFALSVLTNLSSATPATHPDTYRVAQGYADAWLARSPETKGAKQAAICPNCDAELPKGCGGVFKSEGESCALNWPTENRTLP